MPGAGVSYVFDEAVEHDRASMSYELRGEEKMKGSVIWNPDLDGIENFINIVDFMGYHCYADSFEHDSILGAIFDVYGTRKCFIIYHTKYNLTQ